FAEELDAVAVRAHRANTTFRLEKLSVDEHRFIQPFEDEHAGLPEGAAATRYFEQGSVELGPDINDLHDTDHDAVMAGVPPGKALLFLERLRKGKADGFSPIRCIRVCHSN